jgi:hypothetical protein
MRWLAEADAGNRILVGAAIAALLKETARERKV